MIWILERIGTERDLERNGTERDLERNGTERNGTAERNGQNRSVPVPFRSVPFRSVGTERERNGSRFQNFGTERNGTDGI